MMSHVVAPARRGDPTNPTDLRGKKVVLTGTFVTMKRDEAERLLSAAGATSSGSISKHADVLICSESAGPKLAKATSLGVPVMPEAEMVALLLQTGGAAQLVGAPEKLRDRSFILPQV